MHDFSPLSREEHRLFVDAVTKGVDKIMDARDIETQTLKLIEECGELVSQAARSFDNVPEEEFVKFVEELADVYIMLKEFIRNAGFVDSETGEEGKIRPLFERIVIHKVNRELKRIADETEEAEEPGVETEEPEATPETSDNNTSLKEAMKEMLKALDEAIEELNGTFDGKKS